MSAVDKAAICWGVELPEWVLKLAEVCDEASQNQVAKRLGISGAQISQIINRKYNGVYENAEQIVRSKLMAERHVCPALNFEIALERCIENQLRLKGNIMSGSELGFFKTVCPTCPYFKQK